MDVTKVAKVDVERALSIEEVEGMVGLARPARGSAEKLCSRRLENHHVRKDKL